MIEPMLGPDRLRGRRILVAEDLLLAADLIAQHLKEWGCLVVGPAARVHLALELLRRQPVDGALLDLNIGEKNSVPVADALTARGIPFIFVASDGKTGVPTPYQGGAEAQQAIRHAGDGPPGSERRRPDRSPEPDDAGIIRRLTRGGNAVSTLPQ